MTKTAKEVKMDYKSLDLNKAVEQDLKAAISCLDLILNRPEIRHLVVQALEEWRTKMVELEKNKAQA